MTAPSPSSSPPSPRPRLARGEGGRLRGEILDATEQLLLSNGPVTIRAIADAVGVTAPTIYRHFSDRDELLLSVCARSFAHFDEYLETAIAHAVDVSGELSARGQAYVRFGLEHPEQYRLLFMERAEEIDWTRWDPTRLDQSLGPGAEAFGHLVDNIARGQVAGRFVAGDPVLLACTLFAALHGLTSGMIAMTTFPWPPVDTMIDALLTTLQRGIEVRGS